MTDKKELKKVIDDTLFLFPTVSNKQVNKIYSWFQSKQQEKIERVKRLREDFYPKDRFSDGYQIAISDVLEILEK